MPEQIIGDTELTLEAIRDLVSDEKRIFKTLEITPPIVISVSKAANTHTRHVIGEKLKDAIETGGTALDRLDRVIDIIKELLGE